MIAPSFLWSVPASLAAAVSVCDHRMKGRASGPGIGPHQGLSSYRPASVDGRVPASQRLVMERSGGGQEPDDASQTQVGVRMSNTWDKWQKSRILVGPGKSDSQQKIRTQGSCGAWLWPLPLGTDRVGAVISHHCLSTAYYVSGTAVDSSFVTLVNKTDKNPFLKELALSREEKNEGKEKIKEK